jgi:hypothetical protein
MAVEWFYTSDKQRMGPVSWEELRQLAVAGTLKRDELVWTEGMPDWVRADRQNGVFPVEATALQIGADLPPPPPALRAKSRRDRDDDDSADESPREGRPNRRKDEEAGDDRPKSRRDRKKKGGSSAGLWIGLGVGAFVLVLLVGGCVTIGVAAWLIGRGGGGGGGIGPGGTNYSTNLAPTASDRRTFTLRAGQRVNISVSTTRMVGPFQPDVDLFVERRGAVIAADVRVHPDCNVVFVAPANDTYTVRVTNLGPGRASSRVTITAN